MARHEAGYEEESAFLKFGDRVIAERARQPEVSG
jgi:hypothetical protein